MGWQHCVTWESEVRGLKDLRQKVKVKKRIKNKTKQKRKDQFIFKLVDVCKSPIYKITCWLPRSPFAYLLHIYCFLQIFPGKGKDHSEGLATLPAPLCFSRSPFKGVNIRLILYGRDPPCSTACSAPLWCQELCHPSQWLCWFDQHKLHIAKPQGCHFAMGTRAVLWGGVATSLEMKSPQCWARGENLHILFQISWTSQDSFIGFCMLFVLDDEIRYLFRFKWPIYASCSVCPFYARITIADPWEPSQCGSWSCNSEAQWRQQRRSCWAPTAQSELRCFLHWAQKWVSLRFGLYYIANMPWLAALDKASAFILVAFFSSHQRFCGVQPFVALQSLIIWDWSGDNDRTVFFFSPLHK